MSDFNPDWTVHPGVLIAEYIETLGLKQSHLAGACHVSPKHMNQVVKGHKPLHAPLAVAIEVAIGKKCAHVLMRIQADHDVFNERLKVQEYVDAVAGLYRPHGQSKT